MGYVATLPTSGTLLIPPPALKRRGSPRRQGSRCHFALKWATSVWARWLRDACRLGDPHRFTVGDKIRSGLLVGKVAT